MQKDIFMSIFISICIPIYNPNKEYFTLLADSIKNQSYRNYEIIVSDDGNSQMMVDELFAGSNYYYIKNNSDKGIFHNLNCAIRQSKGHYIQIFCQDDIMNSTMLEDLLLTLEQYPMAGIAYTQVDHIDSFGNVIKKNLQYGSNCIKTKELSSYYLIYGCLPGNLSTVMLRRSVINQFGLFDANLDYGGDFEYWARIAGAWDLAINYKSLMQLRVHKDQASFTLSSATLAHDLSITYCKLFEQSNLKKISKIIYINQKVAVSLIIRLLKEFNKTKNFKLLYNIIQLRYPFNFLIAIFFLIIRKYDIINFKKKYPFPLPILN